MTIPLMVLAVFSAFGGFMGFPHSSWLEGWLEPVIPAAVGEVTLGGGMEITLMIVSVLGAALGIAIAVGVFSDLKKADALGKQFSGIRKVLANKWYVDEIYDATIVRPIQALSNFTWKGFDVGVIDRIVVGFGRVSEFTGQTIRVVQTGSIQFYAFVLLIGIVLSVGYLIYGMA